MNLKKLKKKDGVIGGTTLVLGNAALLLGSFREINEQIVKTVGYHWSRYLFWAAVGITLVGYLFGWSWLYRKLPLKKILSGIVASLGAVTILAANLKIIPDGPRVVWESVQGTWRQTMVGTQDGATGGLRTEIKDPTAWPQPWTTAQGLVGMLAEPSLTPKQIDSIRMAFAYIEAARNQSGQEGWGYWERSQPTITEIAAWITLARAKALQHGQIWNEQETPREIERIIRDLEYMSKRQDTTGGWCPILLPQPVQAANRTYSTMMAVWSLVEAHRAPMVRAQLDRVLEDRMRNGIRWLLNTYEEPLGWVPNPSRLQQKVRHPGLIAQILHVLHRAEAVWPELQADSTYKKARQQFLRDDMLVERSVFENTHLSDRDLYIVPGGCPIEGMTYLWLPWTFVAYRHLMEDASLTKEERDTARKRFERLDYRYGEALDDAQSGGTYTLAENLYCVTMAIEGTQFAHKHGSPDSKQSP